MPNGYCKGGSSCATTRKIKRECRQNTCAWTFCSDVNDSSCCDSDTDSRCQYCATNQECVGVQPDPPVTTGNRCFSLKADVSQKAATTGQDGINFYVDLLVNNIARRSGRLNLKVNGNHSSGPDLFDVRQGLLFIYVPRSTKTPIFVRNGTSTTMSFNVKMDECNELGKEDNLNCLFSVDEAGNPYSSCGLKNPPTAEQTQPPGSKPQPAIPVPTLPKCDQKKGECGLMEGEIITNGFSLSKNGYNVDIYIKKSEEKDYGQAVLSSLTDRKWAWTGGIEKTEYDVQARLLFGEGNNRISADQNRPEVTKVQPGTNEGRKIKFTFNHPDAVPVVPVAPGVQPAATDKSFQVKGTITNFSAILGGNRDITIEFTAGANKVTNVKVDTGGGFIAIITPANLTTSAKCSLVARSKLFNMEIGKVDEYDCQVGVHPKNLTLNLIEEHISTKEFNCRIGGNGCGIKDRLQNKPIKLWTASGIGEFGYMPTNAELVKIREVLLSADYKVVIDYLRYDTKDQKNKITWIVDNSGEAIEVKDIFP